MMTTLRPLVAAISQHSDYSFSGSRRWVKGHCPASVRMQRGKPNTSNSAAKEGTVAHTLGERCYLRGLEPSDYLGLEVDDVLITQNMIDAVEVYVSWLRAYRTNVMLEQKVSLTLPCGRGDVYGTADCISFEGRTLHGADYKHGYGLVEVKDNTQLICYAVATLDTYNAWFKVDEVVTTIIQPRAGHIDGTIRSHTYTIDELLMWRGIIVSSIHLADDPDVKPFAGDWCKYCLASANCKARMLKTIDLAFDDEPVTDDTLIALYPHIASIKSNLDSIAEKVEQLAISGRSIDEYKLVNRRKRAKPADEQSLVDDCLDKGFSNDDLYEKKLKSKTKLTKIVGEETIKKHFVTEDAGLELAPMSDNRIAVSKKSATNIFTKVN